MTKVSIPQISTNTMTVQCRLGKNFADFKIHPNTLQGCSWMDSQTRKASAN